MSGMWHRNGSYGSFRSTTPARVEFINLAYFCVVNYIVISRMTWSGPCTVTFHLAPSHENKLLSTARDLLPRSDWKIDINWPNIWDFHFNSQEAFVRLKKLLQDLNDQYGYEEFSQEFFLELEQLSNFLHKKEPLKAHLLPEIKQVESYTHPDETESRELGNLFGKRNISIPALKTILMKAKGNVNQHCKEASPLYYAVMLNDITVLELLLVYGANPCLKNNQWKESALDYAKSKGLTEKFNLMAAILIKIERPLSNQPKVNATKLYYHSQCITTLFQFSNGKIIKTELMPGSNLLLDEKEILYDIYSKAFEGDNINLKELFFNELSTGLIELIKSENKLIGFNLFDIFTLKNRHNQFFVHCMYSLIHAHFRGYGIMSILAFRLATALQLLWITSVIYTVFFSVHFSSFNMVKDFLCFPKYQSEHMTSLMKDILKHIYKNELKYHHDLTTFYVEDKVRTIGSINPNSDNLFERFFIRHMMGLNDSNNPFRAVPECFAIGDDSFKKLEKTAKALSLNLDAHIEEFKQCLSLFFNVELSKNKMTFFQSGPLFHKNEKVLANPPKASY